MSETKSLLLSLLLIFVVSSSLAAQDAMKDIRESFDVSEGITLNSNTRYADVEMITWDKDVVDILAEIEVEASSKSKAEEKLAKIDVKASKSGNTITLETELEEGWSKNAKVKIRIIVKVPAYLNLSMKSSYGDVFIQEIDGLVHMNLRYGNLKADKFGRGNEKPYNVFDLDYSDGVVESVGWAELELSYSDLEITSSSMLFVESKYSKIRGAKCDGIVAEGAYDKYYLDEVGSMVAELKYSGVKFGKLSKKFNLTAKYTNVKVSQVSAGFKEFTVKSSYGNIYLDMEEGSSFKLDASTKYGKINLAMEGKLSKVKEGSSLHIWGSVGSNASASVDIEARYGNIVIE